MTATFTPGPWQRRDDWTGRLTIIGNVDGEELHDGPAYSYTTICDVNDDGDDAADEAHANARLIAAAPDLLAALTGLLTHTHIAESDPADWEPEDHAVESAARAAIARATGAA